MRPLSSDVREFIRLLNTKSVKYVIVGAWAVAYHGRPRYTGDLDVFVSRDPDTAERLMEVIQAFGFGQVGIVRNDFLKPDHVVQLGRAPNRIDILTGISGVSFDETWISRHKGAIDDVTVNIISLELLIKNKQATGRDKDLADIRLLEKTPRRRS
jgi:predicted nucleotidyltransferase